MGGINRAPIGLLDLLLTQAGGRNPDQLIESVRPTLDIEKFYYPDRMNAFNETFSLSQGQLDFVAVPDDQSWLLLGVGSEVDLVTNTEDAQLSYFIERIPGQGLNGILIGSSPYWEIATTNTWEAAHFMWLPTPLLLTAQQRVVVKMARGLSGPHPGNFYGIFVRLETS